MYIKIGITCVYKVASVSHIFFTSVQNISNFYNIPTPSKRITDIIRWDIRRIVFHEMRRVGYINQIAVDLISSLWK